MSAAEQVELISDDGDPRQWRTEIPNMVFDMGLSIYAVGLYGYYKRVCGGAKGGKCIQGVRRIAKALKISTGSVVNARRELKENGLITVAEPERQDQTLTVKIVNIWRKNFERYDQQRCSSGEHPPRASDEHPRAPRERKNEPSKKGSAKADEASSSAPSAFEFMSSFADLLNDAMPLSSRERGKLASAIQRRLDAGDEPKKLRTALCRMVARRQEGQRLELEDVINDVGGAGRPPAKNGKTSAATDEAALEALKEHEKLGPYAYLAAEWDFAGDEDPPRNIMQRLGGTDDEARTNLTKMRSVVRKALRAKEAM